MFVGVYCIMFLRLMLWIQPRQAQMDCLEARISVPAPYFLWVSIGSASNGYLFVYISKIDSLCVLLCILIIMCDGKVWRTPMDKSMILSYFISNFILLTQSQ